jgi:hypothetical protein
MQGGGEIPALLFWPNLPKDIKTLTFQGVRV